MAEQPEMSENQTWNRIGALLTAGGAVTAAVMAPAAISAAAILPNVAGFLLAKELTHKKSRKAQLAAYAVAVPTTASIVFGAGLISFGAIPLTTAVEALGWALPTLGGMAVSRGIAKGAAKMTAGVFGEIGSTIKNTFRLAWDIAKGTAVIGLIAAAGYGVYKMVSNDSDTNETAKVNANKEPEKAETEVETEAEKHIFEIKKNEIPPYTLNTPVKENPFAKMITPENVETNYNAILKQAKEIVQTEEGYNRMQALDNLANEAVAFFAKTQNTEFKNILSKVLDALSADDQKPFIEKTVFACINSNNTKLLDQFLANTPKDLSPTKDQLFDYALGQGNLKMAEHINGKPLSDSEKTDILTNAGLNNVDQLKKLLANNPFSTNIKTATLLEIVTKTVMKGHLGDKDFDQSKARESTYILVSNGADPKSSIEKIRKNTKRVEEIGGYDEQQNATGWINMLQSAAIARLQALFSKSGNDGK